MNRLKEQQKLEKLLEAEAEDLAELGLGHQAELVNAEIRANYHHHVHLYGGVRYPLVQDETRRPY